ncbi:MAG: family 1 glycosylhydrolase [Nocardioides sp.]|nr:family 1 glycosylhydrolase [Nocardioides sp.]
MTDFPEGFLWGAATAAYQIEGAAAEDGRTPSIWDTFTRLPGAVVGGDTGDVACDHYHRVGEDVALMRRLGLQAYRFSTAWPRVRPDGGKVNQAGVDFYIRLVDELLGAGIEPWLTLYHWDLPQALEDQGGWLSRETAHRFVEYATTMYDALGDRVSHWTTLNEPWCSAFQGYTGGQHAPGRQEGVAGVIAAHHLLLAHGMVVEELRRLGAAQLGITLNPSMTWPFDPSRPADVDASRRLDGFHNRVFLEPLFKGRYADDLALDTAEMRFEGRRWQSYVRDGDLGVINQPLDFLGVNYYHPDVPAAEPYDIAPEDVLGSRLTYPARPRTSPYPGGGFVFPRRGLPTTARDWEIDPAALTRLLVRLRDDYDVPPVYITENGAMVHDELVDGAVHDEPRRDFLASHLEAARAAIDKGVDVRGYFAWSLLDNFEWSYGYAHRFGLVHVDFDTLVRTPKDSALWYADVVRRNGLP